MTPTRRDVRGGYLLEFDEVDSTQDVARKLLADEFLIGVRGAWQRAGRGRSRSSWIAAHGKCLLATYIVRGIPVELSGRLAFAAGLAVAEALQQFLPARVELKWPNDALVGGRKIAGILIETAAGNVALCGIGINVNAARLPHEIAGTATSVCIEQSGLLDILIVETEVRERLFAEAGRIEKDWPDLLRRWRERDCSSGRLFRTEDGVEGTACGVAEDGALLLRLDDGSIRACYSASAANG